MQEGEFAAAAAAVREQRQAALRLRAAYMYYVEGLTQNEVADHLGVGRVSVVRLLHEARAREEVRFWIEGPIADCAALERRLETTLGLERAVVCPAPASPENVDQMIGFTAGVVLSEALFDGARLGVGWGRTLHHALSTLSRPGLRDVKVVSMLGGIVRARQHNPSEFAWRVASQLDGECLLFTAPAIVDGPETREALLARCGLDEVVAEARSLDLALVSVGSLAEGATALVHAQQMLRRDVRDELVAAGAVGDLFFNFFDRDGDLVDHPIISRVMSVPVASVRGARSRILASGGRDKVPALLAALRMIQPTTLITDETTAAALLEEAKAAPAPASADPELSS